MKKKNSGMIFREYGILTVCAVILAVSDYALKFPNHFSFGGVTGFAVILSGIFGGTANTYAFVINIVLLLIGFLVLGKDFGIKSVYVSLLFSAVLEGVQYVFPMDGPLTDEPVLELVFSFMILAVAAAVLFNMDASSGGTDIIALIVKKYSNIPIGRALLIVDCCVVILSFFVYDTTVGMFSLAGLLAKSFFIDTVIESLNLCKYFTIVSRDAEPICAFIHTTLNHSATIYTAEGAYSHEPKKVIMTVVNRKQALKLRNFVRAVDPQAFMMITNSSEIIGKGFRNING